MIHFELVTSPSTQHGREVESPPTARTTPSSDLLLPQLREELSVANREIQEEISFLREMQQVKEELTRLKAAPPPPQSQYKQRHRETNLITGSHDL